MIDSTYDDMFDTGSVVGGAPSSYTNGCCMVLDYSSLAMQALTGLSSAKITNNIGGCLTSDQIYQYENESGYSSWSGGLLDRFANVVSILRPSIVMVALDSREQNWRKDIYSSYKFGRESKQKKLANVEWDLFRKAKDLAVDYFRNMGFLVIETKKAEADDIIYCISRMASNVVVVSTDGDMLQLAKWGAKVYNPVKMAFSEELDPAYFLEHKVIMGDSSDFIHSVRGTLASKKSIWPSVLLSKSKDIGVLNYLADNKDENKNITLSLPDGDIETTTAKLYIRNKKLIDMEYIPQEIVNSILADWKSSAESLRYDLTAALNYNTRWTRVISGIVKPFK